MPAYWRGARDAGGRRYAMPRASYDADIKIAQACRAHLSAQPVTTPTTPRTDITEIAAIEPAIISDFAIIDTLFAAIFIIDFRFRHIAAIVVSPLLPFAEVQAEDHLHLSLCRGSECCWLRWPRATFSRYGQIFIDSQLQPEMPSPHHHNRAY